MHQCLGQLGRGHTPKDWHWWSPLSVSERFATEWNTVSQWLHQALLHQSKNYPTSAVSPLHTESVAFFSSSNKTSSGLILVKLNCLESNFCLTIVISCGFLLSVALLTFNCNQVVTLFLIQASIKHIISIYYFTDWAKFYYWLIL